MRFDKSPSGANSISLSMDEATGTRVYFDEHIDGTGEISIVMSDDRFIELRDTLNRLYPLEDTTPTVTLPEAQGMYLTQDRRVVFKNYYDDWSLVGFNSSVVKGFWDGRTYTKDLKSIVSNLGIDAFPLIPVSAKPSKDGD